MHPPSAVNLIRRITLIFRSKKPASSIQLGPWSIVVLTAAGHWALIFILLSSHLTSELIAYFRFGSPHQIAGVHAVQMSQAELVAFYLRQLGWILPLAGWSGVTGACLALGVRRFPVGWGAGILAFVAGIFMSVTAVPITKALSFYEPVTPLFLWLELGVYSMGVPWLLGRAIARLSR
jgi:hypothetical protein